MSELLIFGGTTEGRFLAEFCSRQGIPATVSVATNYGASLLRGVKIRTGKLDCTGMEALLRKEQFGTVVDATHPYATEATRNIRNACQSVGIRYLRLVREQSEIDGDTVPNMQALITYLNRFEGVIFSTLGSKSLPALTEVQNFAERIWIRLLPAESVLAECRKLGFPEMHVFLEKPPFTIEQNVFHLRKSGAQLLVTKESGSTGGYPQKIAAANQCGIRTVTLLRTPEEGLPLPEIIRIITQEGL